MTQTTNALQKHEPSLVMEGSKCVLKGDWVVSAIDNRRKLQKIQQEVKHCAGVAAQWDLLEIRLDHIWAEILWQCWGRKMPNEIVLSQEQEDLFKRVEKHSPSKENLHLHKEENGILADIGFGVFRLIDHFFSFNRLIGFVVLDVFRALRAPSKAPWKDFSGQVLRMGAQALPITGLVGLLIGVVIVYLLSGFLRSYGLELYIINMIGLVSIRELGPLLAAILVAGRSGSTITAQIGVMRLREELDAMHVLGISATYRMVLPRVLALALSMPLISMWTSLLAIFGGMIVAQFSVDITYAYFLETLPHTVSIGNIWMNLGKSAVFGVLIALIGCYFGLRVKSDTESLGNGTTASVVASITSVILADAVFAILCRNVPI